MQKYFLIICLLIDFAVWGQPFRLSMDFRNLGINDTLILSQKNREKYVAIGKYYAGAKKKIIKFKNPAFLSLNINNYKFYKEFIVDSVVTVYFDKSKDSLFVSSSSENRQLQYINDHFTAPFRADLISLNNQKSTFINLKDTAKVDSIELKQSLLMDRLVNDYKNYIYQNRNSYTSIGLINWGYNKFDIYEVEKMLNILNKNLQNNSVVLYLRQRLKIDLSISEGKNIHYFSIIDARGDTFSSTQIEKGIFILDFWGTWCGPCVKAIPLLRKINDNYKAIKVVSYAMEFKSSTKEFNKNELALGIHWKSYLETKDKPTGLLKLFNVTEFPTYFLVKEGKILKRATAIDGLRNIKSIVDAMPLN